MIKNKTNSEIISFFGKFPFPKLSLEDRLLCEEAELFTRCSLLFTRCLLLFARYFLLVACYHSHKKRKDSLEGSLDWVSFAAKLEFPKILVPRLSQHSSNVDTECAGKSEWSKQLYSLYVTSFLEHWYNLILLFWY